ncbi:hypothetical protein H5201_06405 [Pseudoalteromonas sp. SG43-6]|uniref:hypothetical protein n=1 Tax=Pseudoalteromonas sp. SG43-6 TaxID=2760967 RepID=UPI001603014A|nr:hypothetical protein [Pseudoalteromonas sp. SG43-6]MBB1433932.1 hypothetical protein [Pseudoalteromonas sp. SG43-6]
MPANIIKESFRNTEALLSYLRNGRLNNDEFSRILFQGLRRRTPSAPDHIIKNRLKRLFDLENSTILKFLNDVLTSLEERYVEPTHNGQFLIESKNFAEWQELITEVPPLLAVAKALQKKHDFISLVDKSDIKQFFERFLKPQVRYSALPSIKDPRLDELIERLKLDDLHIHLNGSSEIELVWVSALQKPQQFSKELKWAENNDLVKELYSADEIGLTQQEQLKRLRIAGALRRLLLNEVFNQEQPKCDDVNNKKTLSKGFEIQFKDIEYVNHRADFEAAKNATFAALYYADIETLVSKKLEHITPEVRTPLAIEAYYLIAFFDYLENTKNEAFAQALHYYLLIKCQFNRLIVQQTNQYGFDQFQKFTFNEIRSVAEKEYQTRYHQLNYSDLGDLDYLEGRFAPSRDLPSNIKRLRTILSDYKCYQFSELRAHSQSENLRKKHDPFSLSDLLTDKNNFTSLKLSLVAHFIKREDKRTRELNREDKKLSWQCRHYELRNQLEKTRRSLNALSERYTNLGDYLYGFDAAANELDAGPEVFAPIFRRLRTSGYHNFTYHAGEDYVHLLSGIRTVAEAIDFLDLKTGNRIGHGTAVGINPKIWRGRIGDSIVIKRGERLDDLVFAYKHLCEESISGRVLHLIAAEIRRLSLDVYKKAYEPDLLFEAWKLRYLDPLLAFGIKRYKDTYLRNDIKDELEKIEIAERENKDAFLIYKKYHGVTDSTIVFRYEELVEVNTDCSCERSFDYEVFRLLQKYVIGKINRRHMAIESLPTSNVRISFYEHYREHHIFDWLGVTDEKGMEVPVVLGSDDPGIFATNLRNEYAHILLTLENDIGLSSMEAITKLEQIVRNGKIWRFKKLSY